MLMLHDFEFSSKFAPDPHTCRIVRAGPSTESIEYAKGFCSSVYSDIGSQLSLRPADLIGIAAAEPLVLRRRNLQPIVSLGLSSPKRCPLEDGMNMVTSCYIKRPKRGEILPRQPHATHIGSLRGGC